MRTISGYYEVVALIIHAYVRLCAHMLIYPSVRPPGPHHQDVLIGPAEALLQRVRIPCTVIGHWPISVLRTCIGQMQATRACLAYKRCCVPLGGSRPAGFPPRTPLLHHYMSTTCCAGYDLVKGFDGPVGPESLNVVGD